MKYILYICLIFKCNLGNVTTFKVMFRLQAIQNHLEPLVYLRTDTGNSLTTGTFSSQTSTHTAKTMGHFCA